MGSNGNTVQLNILIVGAGIAGLTAATALKQAGHRVTVFESSRLLHEVGAAITLSPNGTRVLAKLGFDFEAARGVRMDSVSYFAGDTLEEKNIYPPGAMDNIEENLGFPYRAFHRVDLHNTLKAMALKIDGTGLEIDLKLGVKIVRVDVENAEIETDDGIVWKGDILIGADGLHSCVRKAALAFCEDTGKDEVSEDGGWDIFRWLLDTKVVEADSELKALFRQGRQTFVYPHEGKTFRLVWYSCRDGEVQNLAAFCPAKPGEPDREDYDASADKNNLLERFSAYHPALLKLMNAADAIKSWRLRNRAPLSTYVYGKTLLIGDAAHPMLPFNAQGGNQALEDCGALFTLFSNLPKKSLLPERSKLFDQVRRKRANRQQIVSSVPAEETKNLGEKLKEYESEGPPNVARSEDMRESILRELGYDVFGRCNEVLRGAK